MPLTLLQLRSPLTVDQALEEDLDTLAALGFNTTAWQTGSVQLTFVRMIATVHSTLTTYADSLSRLAFNATSLGEALTAFSGSQYANDRIVSTPTSGTVVLTGGPVGPPYAVALGQLVVTDANGVTFRNTTTGTIPASGTLDLTFECETPGTAGNVANNTLTILQTPLAGVASNNPAIPATGTWVTSLGTDAESDAALRLRNISKWGTISYSDPADRYENYLRTAVPNLPRIELDDDNPRGPGTLDLYVATTDGSAPTVIDLAAAQTETNRIKNPTADALVFAAALAPEAFAYDCYISAANNTTATQTAVIDALKGYVDGLPIGGSVFPPATTGVWVQSEAVAAMTAIEGVERVDFSPPHNGNVPVAIHSVMTVGSQTPTFFSV